MLCAAISYSVCQPWNPLSAATARGPAFVSCSRSIQQCTSSTANDSVSVSVVALIVLTLRPHRWGYVVRLVSVNERAVQCDVTRLRVLLRISAQQHPPDVHRVAVERVAERGWIRRRIRVNAGAVADRRHEAQPVMSSAEL